MKICVDFSIIRVHFSFQIFFIVYRLTAKFFFDDVADFFLNFITFFSIIFHLLAKKDIPLVLYALICGRNMHKGLFFSIFVTNETFKIFF